MPFSQDDSVVAPARRAASRTESCGGTVTRVPVRASSSSNGSSRTGGGGSSAVNRSVRSRWGSHPASPTVRSTAASNGAGPQQ